MAVVALGGLLGALVRWGVEEVLPQGVLIVNVFGSALLGGVLAVWQSGANALRHERLLTGISSGDDSASGLAEQSLGRAGAQVEISASDDSARGLAGGSFRFPPRLMDGLVGFCGSLTTFSAIAFTAAEHIDSGSFATGVGSLALQFALGIPAAWLGFSLCRRWKAA